MSDRNVLSYKGKTFCASANCKNKCGRKMTDDEEYRLKQLNAMNCNMHVSYAYFCGEPISSVEINRGMRNEMDKC